MSNTFRLKFLGPVQAEQDGEPLRGFRSRKALALLAYLVAQGQPLPRARLADLFWEDQPESRGRANLSWVLNKLKTLLPDCLQADRHTVRFQRAAPYWLDLDAFDGLEARGETSALAEAVALYRGEFLEGLYLEGCAEFELWVVAERERWRQRVLRALETLVAHHSRRGEYEQSLRFARRLLALEPWQEETHRQVMRLLAQSGQRAAALAQYEACRRVLAEELGAEPAEETMALHQRIQAADAARRHNLPPQPTPFVGRKRDLAEIATLLDDPDCRLLTITGPGGVGKTRLALQAGEAKTRIFLEGVYFVPLAAVSSTDFVSAIADALQFSLSGQGDPQVQLLNYLRGKEVLLILDNFEHLIPPSPPPLGRARPACPERSRGELVEGDGGVVELMGEILQKAPEVKLLVTSRERLNLRWAWHFELEGLEHPRAETPASKELGDYSAVQLFQHVARRARRRFALSAQDRPALARICQLVEGMPLGIELAAASVEAHTCTEIAGEIEHNLDILATSMQDMPPRHRSMRATFEYSWRLLSSAEQDVFMRLSVFHRGFSLQAAGEVAAASRAILESLVHKSLLRLLPSGRYEMHELLRQYTVEKLAALPETQSGAYDQHCAHYVAFSQRQESALVGAGVTEALAAIRTEIANVRAAWRWAVQCARLEDIERGLNGLSRFYLFTGPFQEGQRLTRMAADCLRTLLGQECAPEQRTRGVLSRLLAEQARFFNRQGMYEQAIAAAQEAIDLARTSQSPRPEAVGHLQWGTALSFLGNNQAALAQLEQALALTRVAPLRQVEAESLRHLGDVFWDQGDYVKARAYNEQSLRISREIGNRSIENRALNSLGNICVDQGDYVKARANYEQALQINREIGDRQAEGAALNNLSTIFAEQGDYVRGKAYYEQALQVFREIGQRWSESSALDGLGRICADQGNYAEARAYFEQALRINRELGRPRGEGYALNDLGDLFLRQGDCVGARVHFNQALQIRRELGNRWDESETLIGLGSLSVAEGDYDKARAYHQQALQINREIGNRRREGRALHSLGSIVAHLGEYAAARAYQEQALQINREFSNRPGESHALAKLGFICARQGHSAKAEVYLEQALRICREIGERPWEAYVLSNLGYTLTESGRLTEAAEAYGQALSLQRELGQSNLAMEPLAGLACTSLVQDNLIQAQAQVEEILTYLESNTLDGTDEPLRIYLTCYHVLRAAQDPRAQEVLSAGHRLLQERAAKISDAETRRSFLENVAAHREIVELALKTGLDAGAA